ncbi:MAG TPA: signal peptidase I [Sphingomonas sp.]
MPPSTSSTLEKPASARPNGWWETVRFLLGFVLLALVLRTCIVMPRSIPSESMMPRLVIGDYLLVAKWPYGWSRFSLPWMLPAPHGRLLDLAPARGDVVVFRAPPDERSDYIKRLIGLPGDRVRMRDGTLWLNGKAVPKVRLPDFILPMTPNTECRSVAATPYGAGADVEGRPICRFPRYRETLPNGVSYDVLDQADTPQDDTPETIVPAGHYFVMGDNRDMSADSRFPAEPGGGVGFVPADNLEGRALMTFLSTDGSARWWNPVSWFRALRWRRIGQGFR